MTSKVFTKRIALLKQRLCDRQLDAFLIAKDVNVSYVSGFDGHDAVILVTRGKSFFITDSRYVEHVKKTVKGFEVLLAGKTLYEVIREIASGHKLNRIGFESTNLPYSVVVRLKKIVSGSVLVPTTGLVEGLRIIKDSREIQLIKESLRLTRSVLARIRRFVKPGASEESIARKIEMMYLGAGAKSNFSPIVAAGANSSMPHALPTSRKISRNDLVMIDLGCSLAGYNSDLTRMVVTGKPNSRIAKIVDVVQTAQASAIKAVRPGAKLADIDAAARADIAGEGYGKYFGHALGHGVGMEVHEAPSVSSLSSETARPGMVFTIEPAIYMPGLGGVRIEDMVLVTEKGCEVLSK